ncbi:hypothetical protein BJV82DRAFT_713103 [Fennellomyces sp. T-0311]|nr:hypothetical protein BJV82DRAFT_713103 [Fennellomyces sp. T-0311]
MDIIYATFAAIRLSVYATFFIKTKTILRYYYIWIPGLAAFIHDYFLLTDESSPCANHFLYIKMLLNWLAVVAYWRNLDTKNASIPRVTRTIVNYCKPLAILIAMFTVLQLVTDNATEDPSFFYSIVLSLCATSGLIFLGMVWKSPLWKEQPSFLMFGCVFMLVPIHTTLRVIVEYLNANQLLSVPYIQTILTVVLITTTQCEGIIPFRVLLVSYTDGKMVPRSNQPAVTVTSRVDETKTCVLKY